MPKKLEIPGDVQAKLLRLKEAEQQARFLASSTSMRISELQKAVNLNPEGENATGIRREISFQENTLHSQQMRHRSLATLNANIAAFLDKLPLEVELSTAKPVKLKLRDGEDHLDAVERIRGELMALVSERSRIERADLTKDEKKTKIKDWIDEQQKRGSPYVRFEKGKAIVKFSTSIEGAYTPSPDIAAMMAWLDPPAMQKRLLALIDATTEPAFTISTADREQRLKELKKEILALERQEEQLIMAAEERGQIIPRRPVADCRAVLGLVVRGWLQANAA